MRAVLGAAHALYKPSESGTQTAVMRLHPKRVDEAVYA